MYIYKVMSAQDWQESQKLGYVKRLPLDTSFIHICSEEQIAMIVSKFWQHEPKVVIATLDPKEIQQGRLVHEANPGGSNKYYHLYDAEIPLTAVVTVAPWTSDNHAFNARSKQKK